MSMPALRRIAAVSTVVVVLPAVPVIADGRPGPALEQQVAEARDARATSAEQADPRRHLGRPDVEVGDLGLAGVGIEVDAGCTSIPRSRSSCASAARVPDSRAAPGSLRRRAAARARPRRRRIPRSGHPHPDHRGSTSFSRTKARMTSSRSVAAIEVQELFEWLARQVTTRAGARPAVARKLLHSQSSARSTKPCLAAFRSV